MIKIRRALISVSNKSGVIDFAKGLVALGVEIVSTGGTAQLLRENQIPAQDVSSITGFPEMMDGRVKTLHPMVHGGLLAMRNRSSHLDQVRKHKIPLIDMVVVNLYPFEETCAKRGAPLDEVIEQIDIGGPAMIRSGAKNYASVAVLTHPDQYSEVLAELKSNKGGMSGATLSQLAVAAFELSARYDTMVSRFLRNQIDQAIEAGLPDKVELAFKKIKDLRYGENPHQQGAFYLEDGKRHFSEWGKVLAGKELSFNNILDAASAWRLVRAFRKCASAIIKHGTPCGAASAADPESAYRAALATDPESAFGGIVGFNRPVDDKTAKALVETFLEVIIAPSFEKQALEVLKTKKNLRLVEAGPALTEEGSPFEVRFVPGGALVQNTDTSGTAKEEFKVVTQKKPNESEREALRFAWRVVHLARSNAIVLGKATQTVGISAGGTSRVESVRLACKRAGKRSNGAVLASDGFFPHPDNIEVAAQAGITALIQPGGSIKDKEVIAAADQAGLAMVFTGTRHFLH